MIYINVFQMCLCRFFQFQNAYTYTLLADVYFFFIQLKVELVILPQKKYSYSESRKNFYKKKYNIFRIILREKFNKTRKRVCAYSDINLISNHKTIEYLNISYRVLFTIIQTHWLIYMFHRNPKAWKYMQNSNWCCLWPACKIGHFQQLKPFTSIKESLLRLTLGCEQWLRAITQYWFMTRRFD